MRMCLVVVTFWPGVPLHYAGAAARFGAGLVGDGGFPAKRQVRRAGVEVLVVEVLKLRNIQVSPIKWI